MAKTIAEINEKIRKGKAVVVTAEEVIDIAKEKGVSRAVEEIDVVTTGTFGPMCGSGAFFNVGHSRPRMKFGGGKVYLNDVPVYTGTAAVDIFLGATAIPDDDPRNKFYRLRRAVRFHTAWRDRQEHHYGMRHFRLGLDVQFQQLGSGR